MIKLWGRDVDLRTYVSDLSPDVGRALLVGAIVEEHLELLLLAHLDLDEERVADLFGDYKKYQSLGGKIAGARDLGLIDDETCGDLRVIRDVRNAFAHTRERHLDFDAPEVVELIEKCDDDARSAFCERAERAITGIQKKMDRIVADKIVGSEKEGGI